jgi:hypothetical protein
VKKVGNHCFVLKKRINNNKLKSGCHLHKYEHKCAHIYALARAIVVLAYLYPTAQLGCKYACIYAHIYARIYASGILSLTSCDLILRNGTSTELDAFLCKKNEKNGCANTRKPDRLDQLTNLC